MGGGGGTYFHSVGAAGVLGAGGTVINGIPRVAAGLVTGQLEQGPVILAEVQPLFLAAHEEVLAPGHEADQGLGVEPSQLGVGALLAADAAQEAVELQLGAARRGLAGHAQLGGRGRGHPFALQALAARQPWRWAPGTTVFERFLQRLGSREDVLVAAAGA